MKKPKMILFDYGQTLISEAGFDGVRGTTEVMKYATKNVHNLTPEQVQHEAMRLNKELGRFDPTTRHLLQVEIPNAMFNAYLYESQEIELSLAPEEIGRVFWNAAAPGKPTKGIEYFLSYLKNEKIRTGVISNISFENSLLEERINRIIPENDFEFIIATSKYMFRKPNKRIFDLALLKAGLAAEDVWDIGDQYECDIVGARNAGLYPVWYLGAIDMPYKETEDVLIVHDWMELMEKMNQR